MKGIYFFNALSAPRHIADDLNQLRKTVVISDCYIGDVSADVRGIIRAALASVPFDAEGLRLDLADYDIFYMPTVADFQHKNTRHGLPANRNLDGLPC